MAGNQGSKLRLGVDLGTTFTAGAVAVDGHIEPLSLSHRGHSIASVVAVDGDDVVVGDAAELRIAAEPRSGVREPKRRLGDTTPFVIAGEPYGAEALMGHLLASVVASATERHGSPPDEVVLSHPANWGEYKLDLLRETARLAGVPEAELLPEPVAAALSYVEAGKVSPDDTVAVFDFGGGTFDAAVVQVEAAGCTILGSPEGLERMGGVDLDAAVLAHVNESIGGKLSELDAGDPAVERGMAALRSSCTAAKEALSTDSETSIPVNLPALSTEVRITREELEVALRGRIGDTLSSLDRAVASSGKEYGDLAGILLVGGTSRIPMVAEAVASHTGRPVLRDADAKLAIASGAAGRPDLAAGAGGSDQTGAGTSGAKNPAGGGKATDKGASKSSIKDGAAGKAKKSLGDKARAKASKVTPGKAAAGVAAAAAATAAGVAAASMAGATDREDEGSVDEVDPEAVEAEDESMDAFDDDPADGGGPSGSAGGSSGGGGARSSGGGGGGGGRGSSSRSRSSSDTRPGTDDDQAAAGAGSDTATAGTASGGSSAELEAVRENALAQLAEWSPDGADPEESAEVRAELIAMVERYQPAPGQTVEEAIADLKDQVADRTGDYANEIRLDAVIEEQERQREEDRQEDREEADFQRQVDEARAELTERVLAWKAPDGLEPEGAEEFRGDLLAILENYVPVPGSTFEQAEYELRRRFNERARDYRQDVQIDAQTLAIEDGHAPDDEEEPGDTPPVGDGETDGVPDSDEEAGTDPAGQEESEEPDADAGTATETPPDSDSDAKTEDDGEADPGATDAEADPDATDAEADPDATDAEADPEATDDPAEGGAGSDVGDPIEPGQGNAAGVQAEGPVSDGLAGESRLTADVFDDLVEEDDPDPSATGEDVLGSTEAGEAHESGEDALGADLVEEEVDSLVQEETLATTVEDPDDFGSLELDDELEPQIESVPDPEQSFEPALADDDLDLDTPMELDTEEPDAPADVDEPDTDDFDSLGPV